MTAATINRPSIVTRCAACDRLVRLDDTETPDCTFDDAPHCPKCADTHRTDCRTCAAADARSLDLEP